MGLIMINKIPQMFSSPYPNMIELSGRPRRLALVLLQVFGAVLGAVMLYILVQHRISNGLFWDFRAYKHAIEVYSSGGQPYNGSDGLAFIYPPIFLSVFSLGDFTTIYALFACVTLGAAACYLLFEFPSARFGALGFVFGGLGIVSLLTGNFAVFAHGALIALSLWRVKTNSAASRAALVIGIIAFACVKPYFLTYSLMFVLVRRDWLCAALAVGGAALAGVLDMSAHRELYASFLTLLAQKMVDQHFQGMTLWALMGGHWTGAAAHILIVLVCSAYAFRFDKARKIEFLYKFDFGLDQARVFFLLAITLLVNPRIMGYDLCWYMFLVFCCWWEIGNNNEILKRAIQINILSLYPYFFRFLDHAGIETPDVLKGGAISSICFTYGSLILMSFYLRRWEAARKTPFTETPS